MFAEFGLRLPWATRVLLDISEIVERFWVAGAIGLVGLSVVLLWLLVWTPEVIGRALASRRACWASWSWHTAMLIKAGVAKTHAVSIAGLAAGRSSIQQQTDQWAARLSQSTQVGAGELRQDGESQRLLISALHLEDAQDCADVLTQVTYTNLNLEQGKHLWWLSLLSPLSVCFVGTLIGFMVAALFLPLVSLISGLT